MNNAEHAKSLLASVCFKRLRDVVTKLREPSAKKGNVSCAYIMLELAHDTPHLPFDKFVTSVVYVGLAKDCWARALSHIHASLDESKGDSKYMVRTVTKTKFAILVF